MKKLLAVAFSLAMALPVQVFAKGNHPMAGCGLGYILLSNKDNGKVTQVLGATTNATSGNQTFGITSGTSGCTEDGAVKLAKEAEVYAEVNLDSLRKEMAIGDGEFVRTFASLLGAKGTQVPTMLKMFHDEYASLFSSSDTSSAEMLKNLSSTLANHPGLVS